MADIKKPKIQFITFEGGEGSGKTTVIEKIKKDLEELNFTVLKTREPGGSKISEQIRDVILNVENTNMDYMTEALLYAASRRQHLEEIIRPAIKAGKVVICDRYIDSSLAYQGYARGLGIDEVYNLNLVATNGFLPEVTIFIDLDPEVGLERIKNNQREVDRLDLEKINFHEKVREGYLMLASKFPNRFIVVNGNQTREQVYEDVKKIILARV